MQPRGHGKHLCKGCGCGNAAVLCLGVGEQMRVGQLEDDRGHEGIVAAYGRGCTLFRSLAGR